MATWPHNRAASHVWRSIIKTLPTLDKGIKWTIGDGTLVDIWKECWCSTGPLCNRFPGPHTNDNRTVADLIDGNGIWNLTSISHIVDEDVLNSILNIHIPRFSNVQDHPNWMGSSNGNFSTAAAYDLINLSMMSKDGFGFGNLNFQPSSKPLYG